MNNSPSWCAALFVLLGATSSFATDLHVPGHDDLHFDIPAEWKEVQRGQPPGLPPTIQFRAIKPRASLQITAVWDESGSSGLQTPAGLQKIVEANVALVAGTAVEKTVKVIPFESTRGFWFTATDSTYTPEKKTEYPVISMGVLPLGDLTLAFTILSDTKSDLAVKQAIAILMSAKATPISAFEPIHFWQVHLELPPLQAQKHHEATAGLSFQGNAGRTNVSIFVEDPKAETRGHASVAKYYWALASQNPVIVKESVQSSANEHWSRVTYDAAGEYQGEKFHQKNVNYYFEVDGKWVDVHVSVSSPMPADDEIFANIEKTIGCESVKKPAKTAGPSR